ncbi:MULTISPECIES: hypothetical protein [unclassified Streptomyces]|uniref:hypothetical protein n=1 Tax=unclassified Streptomyces TaxID=2593676 RepID=UPI002DDB43A2|nr:hypothetical protein [Streptomyces sp. NBC_01775]WSB75024.1 hypothetical protein OHB04_04000 [Streptomyces sp. NBC_01775]WSS45514.1 hypothetical protein OG220_36600 [Streptomyces sp. NBC_01187]
MCGACGAAATEWTERLAPMDPASARRRAEALTAVLRAAPSPRAHRAAATAWPGGGLRLTRPGGWEFAPSLLSAVRTLTERYGPLVPLAVRGDGAGGAEAGPPEAAHRRLPFAVRAEAAAVWCAAILASGAARPSPVTVDLCAWTVVLREGRGSVHEGGGAHPAVYREQGASGLAEHWATSLRVFRV